MFSFRRGFAMVVAVLAVLVFAAPVNAINTPTDEAVAAGGRDLDDDGFVEEVAETTVDPVQMESDIAVYDEISFVGGDGRPGAMVEAFLRNTWVGPCGYNGELISGEAVPRCNSNGGPVVLLSSFRDTSPVSSFDPMRETVRLLWE